MASVGSGIRIDRAATVSTLAADEMAVCSYTVTAIGDMSSIPVNLSSTYAAAGLSPSPVVRVFGPSESIPNTFGSIVQISTFGFNGTQYFGNQEVSVQYTFSSGVVLVNG